MNPQRRLAARFVLLALADCAQVGAIEGQSPNAAYSPANNGEPSPEPRRHHGRRDSSPLGSWAGGSDLRMP